MSFNEKRSVGDASSYIQFGTYNENFIAFSTFHPAIIANTSHVDTFHFIRLNCLISGFLTGLRNCGICYTKCCSVGYYFSNLLSRINHKNKSISLKGEDKTDNAINNPINIPAFF